jgi:alpha-L-fucosidase 2
MWDWNSALPIGNGRLGAMVHGAIDEEVLHLNEDTIWDRSTEDRTNPDALRNLPEVRRLLFEGKLREAHFLAENALMGNPSRLRPYQPLGDLSLQFMHPDGVRFSDYERDLDLQTAVASVQYSFGNAHFRREYFCSAVDNALVLRLLCSEPGHITFATFLHRALGARSKVENSDCISLYGRAGTEGTQFHAVLRVTPEGGTLRTAGHRVLVRDADAVTIVLTAATDFYGDEPQKKCAQQLAAIPASFDELKARHIAEYEPWFERVELNLEPSSTQDEVQLPTDERLKRVQDGETDHGLVALYFHFGRYLLISCSRPGTLPANLQGIWNPMMTPPWNSDYHPNINLQMNYWPAEVCNLSECHKPLFDWMESTLRSGKHTAQVHYGCRGYVMHHISDPWGFTVPGDMAGCGLWPTGGAWLCDHLWEHFLFTNDRDFLEQRAYPFMKENALFFLDYLVEDEQGRLLSGPSSSPENSFILPDGTTGSLCMGPTMDTQIIRELFTHCIEASTLLGLDDELRQQIEAARDKLPQPQIGKHGQLQEWPEDWDETEPGHRHISPLFGLHPAAQISPHRTPELAQAARRLLERRLEHGGGHTGWSAAWIINFWARLHDAGKAHETVLMLLRKSTLPNLFDTHPPFQIDGNFGGIAGISEMLLQSHDGETAFLPALPQEWSSGFFRGLRARGGLVIDLQWANGKAQSATLHCENSNEYSLRAPHGQSIASVSSGSNAMNWQRSADINIVSLQQGETYEVSFA